MVLISIIIPVYNTPLDKVQRCIDSINAQTYQFYEVILVDDGSEKECAEYLDRIVLCNKQFRVIHKKNEGLAVARNTGVLNAKGEYIIFVDADDYVAPFCLQQAVDCIKKYEPDAVIGLVKRYRECDFTAFDDRASDSLSVRLINSEQGMRRLINHMLGYRYPDLCYKQGYISEGVWSRVCRKELVEQALFTTEPFPHEDTIWSLLFFKKCRNVVIMEEPWYHYLINSDSMTRGFRKNAVEEFEYRIRQKLKIISSMWPDCFQGIYNNIFLRDMPFLCRNYLFNLQNKHTFKQKYLSYQYIIQIDAYVTMLKNISFDSEKRLLHRLIKECVRFFSLHRPVLLSYFIWKVFMKISY